MTIHTLHAYFDQESDLYLYDDKDKGVFKEPLVRSTTEAIHNLLLSSGDWEDIKLRPEHVTLKFTDDPECCLYMQLKQHPIVILHYSSRETEMTRYLVEGMFPPAFVDERVFLDDMSGPTLVDLCDHLMDYFPETPEQFYCQLSVKQDC